MSRYGGDDYDSDRPTRAECEADDFADEVKNALSDAWEETPEGQCLTRLKDEHPHLTRFIAWLEDKYEVYCTDNYDEEAEAILDDRSYHKDIYAYHGVRRSDF
jgi:hypothetical protein